MHRIRQRFSKSPRFKFNLNIQNVLLHALLSFTFIFVAVKIDILNIFINVMNFYFKIGCTCGDTFELA